MESNNLEKILSVVKNRVKQSGEDIKYTLSTLQADKELTILATKACDEAFLHMCLKNCKQQHLEIPHVEYSL